MENAGEHELKGVPDRWPLPGGEQTGVDRRAFPIPSWALTGHAPQHEEPLKRTQDRETLSHCNPGPV